MKALIIEDLAYSRLLFERILKRLGYQVSSAETGREGILKLINVQPDFIILDLNLPDINGREILKSIRYKNIKIPVIVVTAVESKQILFELSEYGISDYIKKPIDVNDFIRRVEKVAKHIKELAPRVTSAESADSAAAEVREESTPQPVVLGAESAVTASTKDIAEKAPVKGIAEKATVKNIGKTAPVKDIAEKETAES